MSWGRQDDDYWDHPKTVALIDKGDDGLAAIGAFWVMNAYCRGRRRGSFSIWEAAGALRRPVDEIESLLAPLLVAPEGFERGVLLLKQTSSRGPTYEINSFDEYRSKNEAKVNAGSQGGKKSAEKRKHQGQAESKQAGSSSSSSTQAGEQQASSPDLPISRSPDPRSPDPRSPDPRSPGSRSPDPSASEAGAEQAEGEGEQVTKADQVIQAVFDARIGLSKPGNELERRILAALPFPLERLTAAIESTRGADRPNWTYLIRCIENPTPPRKKRSSAYEAMKRGGDAFVAGTDDTLAWTRDQPAEGEEGSNA
jgi:hypothetical protein